MSGWANVDAEDLLVALASGEVSEEDPAIRQRLDGDAELRTRWDGIRTTQETLEEECEEMRHALAARSDRADLSEEERILEGFREQMQRGIPDRANPPRPVSAHGDAPGRNGLRALLLVAAAVVLVFLGTKLQRSPQPLEPPPGERTYLEGDAFAQILPEQEFGTLAWTREGALPTDRVSLRAWALDTRGERTALLFEGDDVESPVRVLPAGASSEDAPPGIEFELALQESGSPPRILVVRQVR
ncbi:MAG TPA: hypothetical protein ENJ09_07295 [Planctomycetes bacterium]|nr:hypothetical protein [Planctomycetota bacterium]